MSRSEAIRQLDERRLDGAGELVARLVREYDGALAKLTAVRGERVAA